MTGSTYYRLATFAPFVVPVAGLIAGGLATLVCLPGAEAITAVFGFLAIAAWVGGFPYLLTACIALWWLRGAPVAAYSRTAWLMPLPYAAILGVLFFLIALGEEGTSLPGALGIGAAWAACGLGVGYFYVLLVQWLFRRLRGSGRIVEKS